MPSTLNSFGAAGVSTVRRSTERNIYWGGTAPYKMDSRVSSTARDAGGSPTTSLRAGLLMGMLTANGKLKEWDADGSDGSQYLASVLDVPLKLLGPSGSAEDSDLGLPVRAAVKASQLLIQGDAFVGHIDEYLARRQLHGAGWILDDDPFGYLAGFGERYETVTGTSDEITASQNGMTLIYNNAAAVASELPTIQPGLSFDILRYADEEIVVASAEGNNMIVGNNVTTAGSITFTTAGQQVGARVRVKSIYVGTALKWLVELPSMPFGTGLTGGFTYAIGTA